MADSQEEFREIRAVLRESSNQIQANTTAIGNLTAMMESFAAGVPLRTDEAVLKVTGQVGKLLNNHVGEIKSAINGFHSQLIKWLVAAVIISAIGAEGLRAIITLLGG